MKTSQLIGATASVVLVAGGLLATSTAVGHTDPNIPGTPGYCGAHTDALDCYRDTSPPTPAEADFVKYTGPHFPNVTSTQLVQFARETCDMLRSGTTTAYVVKDLADHIGTTMEWADQVMDGAMEADCPNLTVGSNGVAH